MKIQILNNIAQQGLAEQYYLRSVFSFLEFKRIHIKIYLSNEFNEFKNILSISYQQGNYSILWIK